MESISIYQLGGFIFNNLPKIFHLKNSKYLRLRFFRIVLWIEKFEFFIKSKWTNKLNFFIINACKNKDLRRVFWLKLSFPWSQKTKSETLWEICWKISNRLSQTNSWKRIEIWDENIFLNILASLPSINWI